MDKKTEYIIKTLSRTKRKDYENYVINAIWNRIHNNNVKPVTQQYVYNSDKNEYYFIDLYFPQLNIGVEIDEGHHALQQEYDINRTEAIWYEINKIVVDSTNPYRELRIQVYHKTFEEIEEKINSTVLIIKEKIESTNLKTWIIDTEEYISSLSSLSIYDDVLFPSIKKTCNLLFGTKYNENTGGVISSFFVPNTWNGNSRFTNHKLWFPKLAIEEGGILKSVSKGWHNRLNLDGSIIEFNEQNSKIVKKDYEQVLITEEPVRVTFAQSKDPLGRFGYKFIGIYKKTKKIAVEYNSNFVEAEYYERISEECPIIK